MKLTLSPEEMALAVDVANKRYLYSLVTKGRDSVNGKSWYDGFRAHLLGCIGEIAAAKAIGIAWPASVNRFKSKPDLGNRIEVRHRANPEHELIVRDDDPESSLYLLTVGEGPEVEVVGWIDGKRARQEQWLQTHGGKRESYFVPHRYLYPVEMIREEDDK